jgi:hypothetical protein
MSGKTAGKFRNRTVGVPVRVIGRCRNASSSLEWAARYWSSLACLAARIAAHADDGPSRVSSSESPDRPRSTMQPERPAANAAASENVRDDVDRSIRTASSHELSGEML